MINLESSLSCRVCGDEVADEGYCAVCLDYEVCAECGGHDLQVKMWCRLNGPMAMEVLESAEEETVWCEDCQEPQRSLLRAEFFGELESWLRGDERLDVASPEDLPYGSKYIVRI